MVVAGGELVGVGALAHLPALQIVYITVPQAPDGGQSSVSGLLHQELEQLEGDAVHEVEVRWIHDPFGGHEEFVAQM